MRCKSARVGTLVLTLAIMMVSFASPAAASGLPVTSTDLIEHAREYDGQTVTYSGEAIGDVMKRGDHVWLNVSDGANAIGLWLTVDQAQSINALGSYWLTGDTLTVTGIFHRACAEHGGDMDIHVRELAVTARGHARPHPVDARRIAWAAAFALLALALLAADRRRNRSQKKAEK
ncbi:MAG: DNA-binding protein [Chloroflexota bacterium]